jgi:hypothetical protein
MDGVPVLHGPASRPPARRGRRFWFFAASAGLLVAAALLVGWLMIDRWRDARALRIDNRSDRVLAVAAYSDGMDWYLANTSVPAHSVGELQSSSLWEQPDYVNVTEITRDLGVARLEWTCRWSEIPEGGLIWTEEGANCGGAR